MEPYMKGWNDAMEAIKKEQKPAEWSEEDEKNIEKLDGFLSEVFRYGPVYLTQKDKEKLQSWLKSIRPQPHWKPSKEQMEALNEVVHESSMRMSVRTELMLLEDDLKKL